MTLPVDDNLITNLQAFVDKIPFTKNFGIKVLEAKKGLVKVGLYPKSDLFNHFGTYQAGVYFTAAEVTGGLLCATFLDLSSNLLITQKSAIVFEKATSEPLILSAELSEQFIDESVLTVLTAQKKTTLSADVYVKTPDRKIVAKCQSDYYLRLGIPKIFMRASQAQTA